MEARRRNIFLLIAILLSVGIAGSASSVPSKDTLGIAPQGTPPFGLYPPSSSVAFFQFFLCDTGKGIHLSRLAGVQDEDYYKPGVIKCKDGSKKFTREQLNDEFCDCPDGTDEPGTSACPEGKFYCRNKGHAPMSIFSSRVNDGICDCCDGSDEYDGEVKCTNTCWEAGKAAREKLKKKIATYQEGVILRRVEVEKAKKAFEQDEAELSKLKSEEKILKGLVQRLKDHKERIEKAEEEERLRKEKEEEKLKESENMANGHEKQPEAPLNDTEDVHEVFDTSSLDTVKNSDKSTSEDENIPDIMDQTRFNHDEEPHVVVGNDDHADKTETAEDAKHLDASSNHAEIQEQEDPVNTEGLSKEELGRLVASRWTGEKTTEQTKEDDKAKQESQKDISDVSESNGEDYDGYNSESEEERRKDDGNEAEDDHTDDEYEDNTEPSAAYNHEPEDDMEISDLSIPSSPSWLDKIQQTVRNILQSVNLFKTPVDLSEAAHVRKEYDDSSSKLSKIQSRISRLTEKLKRDFGGDKEFYSFHDHCFEKKEDKYVYKICPFKEASQVEGHSTTRLGSWDKFEESYRVMQFSNGDRCWNGPDRSLKVRFRCGLKNEVMDVDEPSRCEYVSIMLTPVLCLEEKLQELQNKLELMNSGEHLTHDEL